MATTSKRSKQLRGKELPVPPHARCLVCGIASPLETCHIVPKHSLYNHITIDRPLFLDYDGPGVMYLCRNHHRQYDNFELHPDDYAKIRFRVIHTLTNLLLYMSATQSTGVRVDASFYKAIADFIISSQEHGKED